MIVLTFRQTAKRVVDFAVNLDTLALQPFTGTVAAFARYTNFIDALKPRLCLDRSDPLCQIGLVVFERDKQVRFEGDDHVAPNIVDRTRTGAEPA